MLEYQLLVEKRHSVTPVTSRLAPAAKLDSDDDNNWWRQTAI
jgi:hypothetical protein